MPQLAATESIALMETYFKWSERLGVTAVIAGVGFIIIGGMFIWITVKLVESYVAQINDLRKQRDKLQEILAKKLSSESELENLQEKKGKKGEKS